MKKRPTLMLMVAAGAAALGILLLLEDPYDPLAAGRIPARPASQFNFEATVPSMCYTKTAGVSNPCWTCHTRGTPPNHKDDVDLQEAYAFSNFALVNHWTNLFRDRRTAIVATTDQAILAWIREDNYTPLRRALERERSYAGYVPDLAFDQGFDEAGFARDGSGWRAVRYAPFPGTFWPTNGSTDDVFVRLPPKFRGPHPDHYRWNLEILEEAIGTPPEKTTALPAHYAGGAADEPVVRLQYPRGTEFLHTVRYLDPDVPSMLSARMKEIRYSRKIQSPDEWAVTRHYEKEADEKEKSRLPGFAGTPLLGFRNRLSVLLSWAWAYVTFQRGARLITGPSGGEE